MKRALWALALVAIAACGRSSPPSFVLVTTTSVGNSGLLESLWTYYPNVPNVHLVGSGRALTMLASGDGDVAISHAPEAEQAALKAHPSWWYRKIMFNAFVLAGPADDPARVGDAATVLDAMRRIAMRDVPFFSRGDSSGTAEREAQLWRLAGARPMPARLLTTGQGMAATLRIANEQGGYTLTDTATMRQLDDAVDLRIVYGRADPELLNTYAVIVPPGDSDVQQQAMRFGQWLADGHGRDRIGMFVIGGASAFQPWPRNRPRVTPSDTPH